MYCIPERMRVDEITNCTVRIAFADLLFEELSSNLKNYVSQNIETSTVMEVTINSQQPDKDGSKIFEINSISDAQQILSDDSFTEWIFEIRPLRLGKFHLHLKVSIITVVDNREKKRNVVLTKEINVVTLLDSDNEFAYEIDDSLPVFDNDGKNILNAEDLLYSKDNAQASLPDISQSTTIESPRKSNTKKIVPTVSAVFIVLIAGYFSFNTKSSIRSDNLNPQKNISNEEILANQDKIIKEKYLNNYSEISEHYNSLRLDSSHKKTIKSQNLENQIFKIDSLLVATATAKNFDTLKLNELLQSYKEKLQTYEMAIYTPELKLPDQKKQFKNGGFPDTRIETTMPASMPGSRDEDNKKRLAEARDVNEYKKDSTMLANTRDSLRRQYIASDNDIINNSRITDFKAINLKKDEEYITTKAKNTDIIRISLLLTKMLDSLEERIYLLMTNSTTERNYELSTSNLFKKYNDFGDYTTEIKIDTTQYDRYLVTLNLKAKKHFKAGNYTVIVYYNGQKLDGKNIILKKSFLFF